MATAVPSAGPLSGRLHYLPVAVAASVIHMLMMIPGYSEESGGGFNVGEWLSVLAISLVIGALVFAFVVPYAGAVTGLVLGIIAVLSGAVFWAGLTLPLAAAAGVSGWNARARGDRPPLALAALALAAIATVGVIAIIIGDAVAN